MANTQIIGWLTGAIYVAAFLLLSLRARRAAGKSIWLFDAPGQKLPALGFRLAFALLLIWPAERSFNATAPIWPLLAAAGASSALWGQIHMGASWRIGASAGALGRLVTDGPFAWSRNPVFLGQIILGWALVPMAGWLMLAGALLMSCSAALQVRKEESLLSMDPDWRRYAARVPRWIGWRARG